MTNNLYKTKDLAEAAVLIIKNQTLLQIERDGRICWFIFQNKTQCEAIASDFFFGELLVNARDFHEAMGRLKNRIFANY